MHAKFGEHLHVARLAAGEWIQRSRTVIRQSPVIGPLVQLPTCRNPPIPAAVSGSTRLRFWCDVDS